MDIKSRNKEITSRYEKGASSSNLARKFQLSVIQVRRIVKKGGAKPHVGRRSFNKEEVKRNKKIVKQYLQGKGAGQISKEYGFGIHIVYLAINKAGVTRKRSFGRSPVLVKKFADRNKSIVKEYSKGAGVPDLSRKFDLSEGLIRTVLRENEIQLRPPVYPKRGTSPELLLRNHKIRRHFLKGYTSTEIADALRISLPAVKSVIHKLDKAIKLRGFRKRNERLFEVQFPNEKKRTLADNEITTRPFKILYHQKARNQQIAHLYERGETVMKLSHQFGLHDTRVRRIIQNAGIKLRPRQYSKYGSSPGNKNRNRRIIRLYLSGNTPNEIGEKMGLSRKMISKVIGKEGISRNKVVFNPNNKAQLEMKKRDERIADYYLQGDSVSELTVKFALSLTAIRQVLRKQKVHLRPLIYSSKGPGKETVERNKKIMKQHLSGISSNELASSFHLSRSRIQQIIRWLNKQ